MDSIISALSVLLIFILICYNYVDVDIKKYINKEKPSEVEKHARRKYISELRVTLLKSVVINLIFLFVSYLLLPKVWEIITISEFTIWDFDLLNTIFVLIEIGLVGLMSFGIYRTFQIINRLYLK
jgi:hypothetical protein